MNRSFSIVALGFALLSGCSSNDVANDPNDDDSELGASYRAVVTTNPASVDPGAGTLLTVSVTGPQGKVTAFNPIHTQPMHLIAVSSDLNDFIHVHPQPVAGGNLAVKATFALAEKYSLFLEYEPKGTTREQLSKLALSTKGAHAAAPHLSSSQAYDGSSRKEIASGDTKVEVAAVSDGMLMPNMNSHLVVTINDSSGKPVTDLVNWLGMPAHVIFVSEDSKAFIHSHGMPDDGKTHSGGMGNMPGMGGMGGGSAPGALGVDVKFPKAGLYKAFMQFQRGANVRTVPFVVSVMSM